MNFISIIIILISFSVHAEYEILRLSSVIDIRYIYTNSITSVAFEPSVIKLNIKEDDSAFEDVTTHLTILTDIPKDELDIPYIATLIDNLSTCTDYDGDKNDQYQFVKVIFDGEPIVESESSELLTFFDDDGQYKKGDHIVQLIFKPFDKIITSGVPEECDGAITFNIEIDI